MGRTRQQLDGDIGSDDGAVRRPGTPVADGLRAPAPGGAPNASAMLAVQRSAGNRSAVAVAKGTQSAGLRRSDAEPARVDVQRLKIGSFDLGSFKLGSARGGASGASTTGGAASKAPFVGPRTDLVSDELNAVRRSPAMWGAFRSYCEKEFSLENATFIEDLDRLKQGPSLLERIFGTGRSAKGLYDTYIDPAAPKQINLASDKAKAIRERIEADQRDRRRTTPEAFDPGVKAAQENLADTYSRWIVTPEYKLIKAEQDQAGERAAKLKENLSSAGMW